MENYHALQIYSSVIEISSNKIDFRMLF